MAYGMTNVLQRVPRYRFNQQPMPQSQVLGTTPTQVPGLAKAMAPAQAQVPAQAPAAGTMATTPGGGMAATGRGGTMASTPGAGFTLQPGGGMTPVPGAGTVATQGQDLYSKKFLQNYKQVYEKPWGGAWGTEQAWYRTPEWAGGILWNPYYGFQSGSAVKEKYGGGQLTPEQFYALGLTRNPGEDWKQYYQQLTGMTPDQGLAQQAAEMAQQQGGDQAGLEGGLFFKPGTSTVPEQGAGAGGGQGVEGGGYVPGVGGQMSTEEMLARFGYTGPVGVNPYEQQALNFMQQMSRGGGPLATMEPGQQFYGDVLGGAYGPEGEKFRQGVYESTKAGAMQNLEDMQKKTAEQFANQGGYFGGQHALQQGILQQRSADDLAKTLAGLNLEGYTQNMGNMMGAAGALPGMASTQQGIVSDILNNMMSGGNLITQREMTNRSELQNAQQRAYQDWLRAREESMMPFQWAQNLLGFQPTQPIAQQPQPNPWGQFLGGLGQGAGALGTKYATKGMG